MRGGARAVLPAARREARRAALATALFYGVLFAPMGAYLPYWPYWLAEWGLSTGEIGLYLGLGMVVRIAGATLVPACADRIGRRRLVLALFALAGAAVFLWHLWIEERGTLLVATLAGSLLIAPLGALGEALGIRAATRWGFAYGPARAVGSFAFLVVNVVVGALLAPFGPAAVLAAICGGLVAAAMLAPFHPGGALQLETGALQPAARIEDRARWSESLGLLRAPAFLAFAAAASLGQAAHGIYYAFSVLAWQAARIDGTTIGLLWAMGVLAEIVLLVAVGPTRIARIGAIRALALGACAGVARWGLMALEPALWALWPLQALHALTFALAHLGAVGFVAAALPPRLQASAQGFVGGGLGGVAFALITMAGGAIGAAAGPAAAYWLAAGVSAIALGATLMLSRLWHGGRLVADDAAGGQGGRTASGP